METRLLDGRERALCPVCGYIHYVNPKPVAGCIVEHAGGIVLIRRGIEPGLGMWGLPAGYIEWGESAEAAAIRETAEEVGLTVAIQRLLGVYSFASAHGSGVVIFYVATAVSGALAPGDDAASVSIFGPQEVPETIAFSTHCEALTDYRALRRRAS